MADRPESARINPQQRIKELIIKMVVSNQADHHPFMLKI
jgi:hypothetical protein